MAAREYSLHVQSWTSLNKDGMHERGIWSMQSYVVDDVPLLITKMQRYSKTTVTRFAFGAANESARLLQTANTSSILIYSKSYQQCLPMMLWDREYNTIPQLQGLSKLIGRYHDCTGGRHPGQSGGHSWRTNTGC